MISLHVGLTYGINVLKIAIHIFIWQGYGLTRGALPRPRQCGGGAPFAITETFSVPRYCCIR